MAKIKKVNTEQALFTDIARLIDESKSYVAYTANATLTYLYWKIGKRINDDILNNKRAEYGKQIVVSLSRQLVSDYGNNFEDKNIRRMIQFAVAFPEEAIVVSLTRQLSWTHIIALIPLKQPSTDEISKISNADIETASKRILNFFRKAIYSIENEKSSYFKNEYVDEIEESSEIFQFAYTLAKSQDIKENLVRVNAFIITNGSYKGDFPANTLISGYNFYYKIFDVESLYNITEKSHIQIEINFKADGFTVPCIPSPSVNEEYQSYLAIIPGEALASIYERFGSRLLEQNVRSFLQFNGKINKGIRTTIMKEPEMFLAFNNCCNSG